MAKSVKPARQIHAKSGKGKARRRKSDEESVSKAKIDIAMDTPSYEEPVATERLADTDKEHFLQLAKEYIEQGARYWDEIFELAADDLNFAYGSQWERQDLVMREGRPSLTFNQCPQYINSVVGKSLKSKYSIVVSRLSGQNSTIRQEGSQIEYSRSEVMEGMIRDIEQRSCAPDLYARALQHSVEGGFGWLSIAIKTSPDNPFVRELRIRHRRNRFSVMIDPFVNESDFSDARWALEYDDITKEEFDARWPENTPWAGEGRQSMQRNLGNFFSTREEIVRVAKFWVKVPAERVALELVKEMRMPGLDMESMMQAEAEALAQQENEIISAAVESAMSPDAPQEPPPQEMPPENNGVEPVTDPAALEQLMMRGEQVPVKPPMTPRKETIIVYEDEVKSVLDELREEGWKVTKRKKVKTYKIKYMILGQDTILDGPHDWPSMHLPIVPVIGRCADTQDGFNYAGLIRYVQDAQRMINVFFSFAVEKIALGPKQYFIITSDQIRGHDDQWRSANTSNNIFLTYNHEDGQPAPVRTVPQAFAPGEFQIVEMGRQMFRDTIGIHEASVGQKTNEVSGRAIQARDEQADVGNYEFLNNTAVAVRRIGTILTDMIPRIYDNETAQRIILPDGNEAYVELNRMIEDEESGRKFKINALNHTRYSCSVQVGAETRTQREAFVNVLSELGSSNPQLVSILSDFIVDHIDIPGGGKAVSQRVKRAMPRHLLSPEEQEMYPEPPPSPEVMAQMEELKTRQVEAQAKAKIAELQVEQARLRTYGDQAARDLQIAKKVNQDKQQASDGGGDGKADEEAMEKKILQMVNKAVNEAVGKAVAKDPPK